MSHKSKKIWAGALAALLALFAAVVVAATPAKAAGEPTINGGEISAAINIGQVFGTNGQNNGNTGSDPIVTVSGTTITLNKSVQVASTYTPAITFGSGTWTLDLNGNSIIGNVSANNSTGNATVECVISVAQGADVTIENGTITNTNADTSAGVCGVNVSGAATFLDLDVNAGGSWQTTNALIYPAVNVSSTGNLTIGAPGEEDETTITVTAKADASNGGSAITVSGTLTMNGGSVENNPNTANYDCAGIMVSNNGVANIAGGSVKSGSNKGDGLLVFDNATVNVTGGEITGGGSGVNLSVPIGETTSADDSATITISGGTVTGGTNSVAASNSSGVGGANDQFAPGNITVSGDAVLNGNVKNQGLAKSGITIEGGTVNGSVEVPGTSKGTTTVKPGVTVTKPVPPSLLDGVGAQGIDKKGNITYYASIDDVPANQTPLQLTDSMQVISAGLAADATAATTAINNVLKNFNTTLNASSGLNTTISSGKNLVWVVWYGSEAKAMNLGVDATAVGSVSTASGDNGIAWAGNVGVAWYALDATPGANGVSDVSPTGTYTVQVQAKTGSASASTTVDVAGLTVFNPAGSSVSTTVPNATVSVSFYQVSDTPVKNMPPAVTPATGSTLAAVGYYQLTPSGSGTKVSYTPSLWSEEQYTPSTATMTYLMAGYSTVPKGGMTAALDVTPTNMIMGQAGTATLTVTVSDEAADNAVTLAQPSTKLNITGESKLVTDEAAAIQSVATVLKSSAASSMNKQYAFANADTETINWAGASGSTITLKGSPVVNGDTVTCTLTVTPATPAGDDTYKPYYLGLSANLSSLGIDAGSIGTGPVPAPELEQPAAIVNVFPGVTTAAVGNGTVTQTVDAQGNVTVQAVPGTGATFVGWKLNGATDMTFTGPIYVFPASQITKVITITAYFEGGTAPEPPATDTVDITRLYNPYLNGAHLLSASASEVANLKAAGWTVEGTAFTEYATADANNGQVVPVYRLYNPYNGDHFYTASNAEAETMKAGGWQREGTAWYAPVNSNVGVTRLYNPYMTENAGLGNHLWSANYSEVSPLIGVGWRDEGRAWFAVSAPSA